MLLPFILLFALYVQLHGDYGAGGGFQAGVIFASAFILYDLVFGEGDARLILSPSLLQRLAAGGVLLYATVGLYGLLRGTHFLDYNRLLTDPIAGQHLGILLVELGVGITVFSVVLNIFYAFSGRAQVRVNNDNVQGSGGDNE
jgi:multicomponent Na+:H+ antiporter subunit B